MAVRNDFLAGEILAASDLNDTFAAKLAIAGGKILQIVRATDATQRTTTSGSFVDVTGMSVTITPQKSDSQLFIFSIFHGLIDGTATGTHVADYQITDDSNNALSGAEEMKIQIRAATDGLGVSNSSPVVMIGRVTPATTSPVTFKLRFRQSGSGGTRQAFVRNQLSTGQMLGIEVSA